MKFLLSEYQLHFTPDYNCIQVVPREKPTEPARELPLESEVELVLDIDSDEFNIVSPPTKRSGRVVKVDVKCIPDAYFGLDSITYSGIGISDVRDESRKIDVFDLKQCSLTFYRTTVADGIPVMRMTGTGFDENTDFHSSCCRQTIHQPI